MCHPLGGGKKKMNSYSMINLLIVGLLVAVVVYVIGCRNNDKLIVSGIYSVNSGSGKYGIIKILVLDSNVVHIRIYANKFVNRPSQLDTSKLFLGTIHDKEFGVGHMPIAISELLQWEPRLIMKQSITQEELEGYNIWKEDNGGVFGKP
jgi:hypothetical protein